MYVENDKYQHRNIEIIALFVTPGTPQRGTSRHLICIYTLSFIYLLILRVVFIAFYVFPLHVNKYVNKYFKHYYNDRNHLVLKYIIFYLCK